MSKSEQCVTPERFANARLCAAGAAAQAVLQDIAALKEKVAPTSSLMTPRPLQTSPHSSWRSTASAQ